MIYLKTFNENLHNNYELELKIKSDIMDIIVEFEDKCVYSYIICNLDANDFLQIELININNIDKSEILNRVEYIKDYLQDISKNIIVKYSPSLQFIENESILSDTLTDDIMDYGNDELFIIFYKK